MRSLSTLFLALVALYPTAAISAQEAQNKPHKATITGEVIDISGYAQKGARGEEFAEAGAYRAEKGFPVGILTEEGEIYIAIYRDPAPASALEPANTQLAPLMGKEVVAQGTVYEGGGIKLIEISLVAEM